MIRSAHLFIALLAGLLLSACNPPDLDEPTSASFWLEHHRVILDKTHIMSVKSALYQPSFELQGIILPKQQSNLGPSDNGTILHILVKPKQVVKKGTPLAIIAPIQYDPNQKPNNITIVAPFDGVIDKLYAKPNAYTSKDAILFVINSHEFKFTSLLPQALAKQLQIGQSVNFAITNTNRNNTQKNNDGQNFVGQIASISPSKDGTVSVVVHILPNKKTHLKKGMQVSGRVNYGDLAVGTVIPKHALTDGTSLKSLESPPYKPAVPIPAHIWVIHQDAKLSLSTVEVVEYQPSTGRYLVSGIAQDGLIVTAKLPNVADGKLAYIR